ncbi:HAMP domain-containing sensor histidine kinase [Nonomuraea sp. NPDC046802]|uniref:HAMP domain-containing sensor histidine kinase n=1 Tax=Nonomuraea sp. NPDC046802 TaxID=3154919 RepID=UPI0033FC158E
MIAALVFTGASVLTLITIPGNLYDVVQGRIELAVRRVASQAKAGQLPPSLVAPARIYLLEVVSANGEVLARSLGRPRNPQLVALHPARPETIYTKEIFLSQKDVPEAHFLIMALTVDTPTGPATVYGATSMADVDRALKWIYVLVFLCTPLVLLSVASLTWTMVGFAMRPVERIRAEMAEITGKDLSRRVPVPDTGDEITHLATTTNNTLDRLERSAETQRRFVADASHELRSPISALRAQLELANTYPDETDWQTTGAQALAAADRITHIIDELLMLARLDAGAAVNRREVDICRLAEEQIHRREGSRVPIVLAACQACPVLGSPIQLDRLLTNLLDNATRHAATRIDVEAKVEGDRVIVTVTDDGDGVPPEARERIFERFTRLESARAKDKGGSGLGLPLSREIATAHQGTLTIADHSPGARFVVNLPLHTPPPKQK